MISPSGSRRAVLVGASIAGLGSARALAEHVDEVVLIERDPLPDEPVAPWSIATSEDYRYPTTDGPPRPWAARAVHWYGDRVVRAALRNPDVHTRWIRVVNLLDEPSKLLTPGVLGPALAATGRRS